MYATLCQYALYSNLNKYRYIIDTDIEAGFENPVQLDSDWNFCQNLLIFSHNPSDQLYIHLDFFPLYTQSPVFPTIHFHSIHSQLLGFF